MRSSSLKDDGILCKLDSDAICMKKIFDDFKTVKNILFFGILKQVQLITLKKMI